MFVKYIFLKYRKQRSCSVYPKNNKNKTLNEPNIKKILFISN